MKNKLPDGQAAASDDSLSWVMRALLDAMESEPTNAFRAVQHHPVAVTALDAARQACPEVYWHTLVYPGQRLQESVLRAAFPLSTGAQLGHLIFLFNEFSFVEEHFTQVIATYEGEVGSVDKSRHLVGALALNLARGMAMTFPKTPNFWNSTKVFCSSESVLEFFSALSQLHRGRPDAFFKAHAGILKRVYPQS